MIVDPQASVLPVAVEQLPRNIPEGLPTAPDVIGDSHAVHQP